MDRSLLGDASFIETDVRGVFVLLEEARRRGVERFVQISTDEVYGSIPQGSFTEDSPLNPRNPYSASKAGGDRLAYSYWASYGVPVVITRASNNYGPVPVSREAHPALRDQRARRRAAAALRRRPQRPRLALRRGPRRGDRLPARSRARRGRPTTSPAATRWRTSRSRGASSRSSGSPRPSSASWTTVPDTTAATRSTPPSSRALGFTPRTAFEDGLCRDDPLVSRSSRNGGGPSRRRTRRTGSSTGRSTSDRLATSTATAKEPG